MTKTTSFQPVKAYHSRKFLESPDARPIRILAEYLEPLERFEDERIRDTILVFGSARLLPRDVATERLEAAQRKGDGVERAERGAIGLLGECEFACQPLESAGEGREGRPLARAAGAGGRHGAQPGFGPAAAGLSDAGLVNGLQTLIGEGLADRRRTATPSC